jgi:protein-disulfide isomerase
MKISQLLQKAKLESERLNSLLILLILAVQVVLLILLNNKVGRLELAIYRPATSNFSPTPAIIERIPDERGQVSGPADAQITIVEFADFQCPYCADAARSVNDLLAKYPGKIRFAYRHFPLTGHSNAFRAAEAGECAGEQGKFWEMHDILFANQTVLNEEKLFSYAAEIGLDQTKFADCMESRRTRAAIEQDLADGQKYGVIGTPTFFLNNTMFMSMPDLETAVQKALTKP